MQLPKSLLLVAVALATSATALNAVDVFADGGCGQYVTTFEPGHSGECLGADPTKSIRVTSVDSGCSVTAYSDGSCSFNARQIDIGACIVNAGGFSVDCDSALRGSHNRPPKVLFKAPHVYLA